MAKKKAATATTKVPTKRSAPKEKPSPASKPSKPANKPGSPANKPGTPATKPDTPVRTSGAGRPGGSPNYVPSVPLEVRDVGKMQGHFDKPTGPRWIRVYAKDVEDSLMLGALKQLIEGEDPTLMKLLKKTASN